MNHHLVRAQRAGQPSLLQRGLVGQPDACGDCTRFSHASHILGVEWCARPEGVVFQNSHAMACPSLSGSAAGGDPHLFQGRVKYSGFLFSVPTLFFIGSPICI